MAPSRSSERQPYRPQRDYNSDLPSRYQQLPQQSYPSRRQSQQSRTRSPPRRDYPRRDTRPLPRRSEPLPRRMPARDDYRRTSDYPRRRDGVRRLPERDSSGRRPARVDRSKWLPPVRNPARYITTETREEADNRYPVRELTPIPESRRRDSQNRSRSPIERASRERNGSLSGENLPRREGPRTPPPEHEPSTSEHSHDGMLDEEEQEIIDIVHGLFKSCYHETNRDVQFDRFAWLKDRILRIQDDLDEMNRAQELELVDSTDRQATSSSNQQQIDHDLNGDDELDFQDEPDSSSRLNDDDGIKSPPPEDLQLVNEGIRLSNYTKFSSTNFNRLYSNSPSLYSSFLNTGTLVSSFG